MAARKLTHAQVSQLGGLAAAASMTAEQRRARSAKGAEVSNSRFASEAERKLHYTRMAHRRWGREVTI